MNNLIKTNEIIDKKLKKFYNIHLNCPINLTAIKEENEFYLKHYYDSIYYFQNYEEISNSLINKNLADIGSGGGFPGIVLAIFYPQLKVTLVESIGKKCKFLQDATNLLELENVEILNTRVENIKNKYFDIITARGVAPIKEVLKNSFNISKQSTKWIMYKGEKLEDEIKEALSVIKKRCLHVEKVRVERPITRTYCIIYR